MPREKRNGTYTRLLAEAIQKADVTVEDAAKLLDVKVDTLNGWLYVTSRAEAPKWAYDLFVARQKS